MKKLLKKEMTLSASPLSYWFLAFAAMTMIPGYPILISGFFLCLGIFYSFQFGREANDVLYTALLPCRKGDVVRAKYAFVCLIQGTGWALSAVLTAVRMTVLSGAEVYINNQMLAATPAYLGCLLLIFSAFNGIFLGGFFKNAYRLGAPFLGFAVTAFVIVAAAEALIHVPGLESLNRISGGSPAQWGMLLVGLIVYARVTAFSCHRSEGRFEALDL